MLIVNCYNNSYVIALQVLNRKLNHLKIAEFTAKLYAPFKNKEEDMKNAAKTAMLLVKLLLLLIRTDFLMNKLILTFLLLHSANLPMKMVTLRILQSQTSGTSLWTLPTHGIRLVFQTNGQHCVLKMNPSTVKPWKHHIKCKGCVSEACKSMFLAILSAV